MIRQNNTLEEMYQLMSRMDRTAPNQDEPMDTPMDMDQNTGIRKE